jgi:hypothetical protein
MMAPLNLFICLISREILPPLGPCRRYRQLNLGDVDGLESFGAFVHLELHLVLFL